MKLMIEFDLPFKECEKCHAFDPVIENVKIEINNNQFNYSRQATCKGKNFCKYLQGNVFGGKA